MPLPGSQSRNSQSQASPICRSVPLNCADSVLAARDDGHLVIARAGEVIGHFHSGVVAHLAERLAELRGEIFRAAIPNQRDPVPIPGLSSRGLAERDLLAAGRFTGSVAAKSRPC